MLLGYNTNGFAHHAPHEAMELLAEIGYRAVGLTIDQGVLNPRDPASAAQAPRLRRLAKKLGLTLVVETGARYLLDPRTKHEPTLVSADPDRRDARVAFYQQAIEIGHELGACSVSIWSGVVRDNASNDEAYDRLIPSLTEVLTSAARIGMPIAFEPEPGMLVSTLADYEQLKERLVTNGAPVEALRLTVDIGHLHCNQEGSIPGLLQKHSDELANLHIEDMRSGVHEHLMLGEGEIEFPPVLTTLNAIGYQGPVQVELSRHSHMAPEAARHAYEFLAPMVGQGGARLD